MIECALLLMYRICCLTHARSPIISDGSGGARQYQGCPYASCARARPTTPSQSNNARACARCFVRRHTHTRARARTHTHSLSFSGRTQLGCGPGSLLVDIAENVCFLVRQRLQQERSSRQRVEHSCHTPHPHPTGLPQEPQRVGTNVHFLPVPVRGYAAR